MRYICLLISISFVDLTNILTFILTLAASYWCSQGVQQQIIRIQVHIHPLSLHIEWLWFVQLRKGLFFYRYPFKNATVGGGSKGNIILFSKIPVQNTGVRGSSGDHLKLVYHPRLHHSNVLFCSLPRSKLFFSSLVQRQFFFQHFTGNKFFFFENPPAPPPPKSNGPPTPYCLIRAIIPCLTANRHAYTAIEYEKKDCQSVILDNWSQNKSKSTVSLCIPTSPVPSLNFGVWVRGIETWTTNITVIVW